MRLNQAKARRQLRRDSPVPRRGCYAQGGIVWTDEAQRLTPEMMRAVRPVDRFTLTPHEISGQDWLASLSRASIESFIYSRAACETCGHRRKDHDGPFTACRRYDTPECPCVEFIEQEDE